MGLNLSPILDRKVISLKNLANKTLAVDASIEIHQFLAMIRKEDGSLFTNKKGIVTSHLIGLLFRTSRLICDYGIRLIFVFDGEPPKLKERILAQRREAKERALEEWREALARGDYRKAFSKAVVTGMLNKEIIESAKTLLKLLGIPYVEAPSEAEAQAAYMAANGHAWACATKDYDALLFGAPRIVRYLSIKGFEFLPSKGVFRPIKPELIISDEVFSKLGIDRLALIDMAILIGTDFNVGVKGIGPKKALEIIKKYKRLENLPPSIKKQLPSNYEEIREFFLNPPVIKNVKIESKGIDEENLMRFLVDEMDFNEERVRKVVERMKAARSEAGLQGWISHESS